MFNSIRTLNKARSCSITVKERPRVDFCWCLHKISIDKLCPRGAKQQQSEQSPWWYPVGVRPAADRLLQPLQPRSSWEEKLLSLYPSSPPGMAGTVSRPTVRVSPPAASSHTAARSVCGRCHEHRLSVSVPLSVCLLYHCVSVCLWLSMSVCSTRLSALPVRLSVCLFHCLSVFCTTFCESSCLSACLCNCLSAYPPQYCSCICLPVCFIGLSSLSACLFLWLSGFLSACLHALPSVCLCVCLPASTTCLLRWSSDRGSGLCLGVCRTWEEFMSHLFLRRYSTKKNRKWKERKTEDTFAREKTNKMICWTNVVNYSTTPWDWGI